MYYDAKCAQLFLSNNKLYIKTTENACNRNYLRKHKLCNFQMQFRFIDLKTQFLHILSRRSNVGNMKFGMLGAVFACNANSWINENLKPQIFDTFEDMICNKCA